VGGPANRYSNTAEIPLGLLYADPESDSRKGCKFEFYILYVRVFIAAEKKETKTFKTSSKK